MTQQVKEKGAAGNGTLDNETRRAGVEFVSSRIIAQNTAERKRQFSPATSRLLDQAVERFERHASAAERHQRSAGEHLHAADHHIYHARAALDVRRALERLVANG